MKKEKKERKNGAGSSAIQLPVLILNLIIVAISVVAIVTLYVGTFWQLKTEVTIDKELIGKLVYSETETPEGIKAADSLDSFSFSDIMGYLDDDFELHFNVQIGLEGEDLVLAAVGQDQTNTVKEEIANQVNAMVDSISQNFETIMKVAMKAVVQIPVEKAKDAIREELIKTTGSADDNAVMQKMEEEYGISEGQIDQLSDEMNATIDALMEGDTQKSKAVLENSSTIDSLIAIYAEQELKDGGTTPSPEDIDLKAKELKNNILDQYDETIESMEVDGKFSPENAMFNLISATGLLDGEEVVQGEGEGQEKVLPFQDKAQLKTYVTEKLMAVVSGEETMNIVNIILQVIGIFLLVVMASWAYLILKIIIKLPFKNKTISMVAPRLLGWIPHVFLVGIPSLIFIFLPQIALKITDSLGSGISEKILAVLDGISFRCHSLTWVSALCSVLLLVVGFFYRPLRKKAKNS